MENVEKLLNNNTTTSRQEISNGVSLLQRMKNRSLPIKQDGRKVSSSCNYYNGKERAGQTNNQPRPFMFWKVRYNSASEEVEFEKLEVEDDTMFYDWVDTGRQERRGAICEELEKRTQVNSHSLYELRQSIVRYHKLEQCGMA